MQTVTDKIEENVTKAQWDTSTENNPDNNGVLATKLETTD